jgi:UDP-N-acetylmuramoylalanine--D-glutamate ligase
MSGSRIAVFGLGRSGLGIARAALASGDLPHIYDQSTEGAISKKDALDEARSLGVLVSLDWDGTLEAGTDFLVLNPAVPSDHPFVRGALAAGIPVIGEIEYAYRISKAPIVAITGTNGKSTTTVMTYLCLRACGVDAVLCGNIFGSGYPEQSLTEAALASTPEQVLVAEVSSFQLEWTKDFRPAVAGITNIWPDHLDRYESFQDYTAAKHRIFASMRAGDFAVVRANDPMVVPPGGSRSAYKPRGRRQAASSAGGSIPAVLTFGATGEHARVEERDLVVLGHRIPLEYLPFSEPHNHQNAAMAALLAAAALAYREHADQAEFQPCLADGLNTFHGLAHRMELVGEREGVRVINNSMCTNPDAVMKSVQAVKDRTHILMGGVNKRLDFGPLRHYLANHRHRVYLFGKDAETLREMLALDAPLYASMEDAFKAAVQSATKGEVVMLAPGCASTDSFRDFRDRGNVFKAIATDWLRT